MFSTAVQAAAVTASAPDNCVLTVHIATCSYTAAGQYALPLPAGVTSAQVDAFGAAGGVEYYNHTGSGAGGSASGTIDVSTTASLWVFVGGVGGGPGTNHPPGGYNGGGAGGSFGGGGGGGASDVRTSDGLLGSRLLVAAGGGGAGGSAATTSVAPGGAADAAGAGTGRAGGGGPGTQSAGGDGGTSNIGQPGAAGSFGNGGSMSTVYGGGGGAGYFGGGSGGGGDDGRGGGGGGGSSFVPLGGTTGVAVNTPASVTVTFTATAPDAPTGATATAGIGQADVSWTDSAYDWGFAITGYTVTATDSTNALNGGQTCTGASTSCTVAALTPGDSYTFAVVANSTPNSASSGPSNAVNPTSVPVVTTSPTTQTAADGSTVTFTAAATGYPAPDVQWQLSTDGGDSFADIGGATSTSYTTPTLAPSDNGSQYRAVFTNSADTATTEIATLTVEYAPIITTSPTTQTVAAGSTVTLTAAASGQPAPSVQWQLSTDGGGSFADILNATSTSYTSPTLTAADDGNQYQAIFTNSVDSTATAAATVTITYAPTVTTDPASQTAAVGDTATFTAAASGNPAPSVQWQLSTDGGDSFADISGETATSFSTPMLTAADNGNQYRAVFTNDTDTAVSAAATLTVEYGPIITTSPTTQTVAAGSTVTLTAAASGQPAPSVQWQLSTDGGASFADIASGTSTSYTSPTLTPADDGNQYQAVFTNSIDAATTSAATITVTDPATVLTDPVSQTAAVGDTATFTASATGNPAPSVQWQLSTDGGASFADISGATATTYTTPTLTASDDGTEYEAVFTNSTNTATTAVATLTVDYAPVVGTQPSDGGANAGGTVTFSATASGTPNPTVQWQLSLNGGTTFAPISGATSTSYTTPILAAQDDGNVYNAVFTNGSGSATTDAATLTVGYAATITTQPVDQTRPGGGTATFTADAVAKPAATVQWLKSTDGGTTFVAIAGATTITYTTAALTAADDATQYEARFSNGVGVTDTDAATLTVPDPSITARDSDAHLLGAHPTLAAGARITLRLSYFRPDSKYALTLHSTPVALGSVTTDADGSATRLVTVPAGLAAGEHTVVVSNSAGTAVLSYAFTIAAAPSGPASTGSAGSLANTGADVSSLIVLAALLLLIGVELTLGCRRRTVR
jgi:glycine rich protein/fibronectin type III domain protein/Ig-like domain-containing protein/immunoglobulin I-set domain protein